MSDYPNEADYRLSAFIAQLCAVNQLWQGSVDVFSCTSVLHSDFPDPLSVATVIQEIGYAVKPASSRPHARAFRHFILRYFYWTRIVLGSQPTSGDSIRSCCA